MTSVVTICNRALALLGDSATVSSIDPPEGSVQAERCAQFYPETRDEVLQMVPWSFASEIVALQLTERPTPGWGYAYFLPNNALQVWSLYPAPGEEAPGEEDIPFRLLSDASDRAIVLTDKINAWALITKRVVLPTRFPQTFVSAVEFHLASYLAGPILKGAAGRKASQEMAQMARAELSKATLIDAAQRNRKLDYQPRSMAVRGVSLPQNRGFNIRA